MVHASTQQASSNIDQGSIVIISLFMIFQVSPKMPFPTSSLYRQVLDFIYLKARCDDSVSKAVSPEISNWKVLTSSAALLQILQVFVK